MLDFLFKISDQKIKELLKKANDFYNQKDFARAAGIYRKILKADPLYFAALANLAVSYFELKDYKAARPLFEKLCREDANNPWWHNYLSQVCQQTGHLPEALEEAWQAVVLSDGQKEHQLNLAYTIYETADMGGRSAVDSVLRQWRRKYPRNAIVRQSYKSFYPDAEFTCSEAEYVEELFDVFAPDFDAVLADLHYRSPQDIASLLAAFFSKNILQKKQILDLGCGSGLCAQEIAAKLPNGCFTGIDISGGMLREAQKKNIYNRLIKCNIFDCDKILKQRFDIVVAADVLTYFGELKKFFAVVRKMLPQGGVFAFTVSENMVNQKDFFLMPSSRFVHRAEYVEKSLLELGFSILENKHDVLREEGGKKVFGRIFLAVVK